MPPRRNKTEASSGTIPSAIRCARAWADLTVQDLADKCGVAHSTVSRWESGVTQLDPDYIPTIAEACGVPEYLFVDGFRSDGPVDAGARITIVIEQLQALRRELG